MGRRASRGQLGTPLKTRPTGISNLPLEHTNHYFSFLLYSNTFSHLHVKTKNGFFLFCFFGFSFFIFAPCGRNSVYLPLASEPPLLSNPLHEKQKKKNHDWQFGVLGSVCLFPSFSPSQKKPPLHTETIRLSVEYQCEDQLISERRSASLPAANSAEATGTPNKEAECLDVWPSGGSALFVGGVGRCRRIYICVHPRGMCVNINIWPNVHFQHRGTKNKRNTNTQTRRVSHTAGGMRGATAFRTGAAQIEVPSNSPVLKAAF